MNPYDALTSDGQSVRGKSITLVDDVDAYCVAPDVHQVDSCFHQQEAEAAQTMVQALIEQGLPAVLPGFIQEREGVGEFVWRCPQQEGNACTPETCVHAQDDPTGFVVVVQMDGNREMVCVNAECGQAAQEALADWEAEERRRERQRWQAALNSLRRLSIERTLLAPTDRALDLSVRSLLEAVEAVLVPGWDTPTMFHVVLGWQEAMRAQIAVELGSDPTAREVSRVFRERWGQLADRPTDDAIVAMFTTLRERMAQSDEGLRRCVTCLALVRTWRDRVETTDQIAESICRVAAYGQAESPVQPSRAE